MGVNGLWKLLDSSGKAIPLEALENRVLAVDVSIWLYQLVKGFQESGSISVANPYLIGLFHRICKLLFYRIKPIFVFDGGVPLLKRRTIADRQNHRSKANRVGDRLRQTLLENLAKQEALGGVLGESVVLPRLFQEKQDTLFQLPPLPPTQQTADSERSSESEEEDGKLRYKDIHSIDITSDEFLSLPADMRHDILTELKETRKQNSWGRLHLIPKESNDFSDYQMRRLLKRRAVQVGIEQAEGEMGTRGFTISDLQSILSEQGIEFAQRIAADSSTRLLYSNKIKEIVKDKAVTPKNTNKRPKLTLGEVKYNSGSEDDPDEFMSSQESNPSGENSLTQSEILQLIKLGQNPRAKPDLQAAAELKEPRNAETEEAGELNVNGEEGVGMEDTEDNGEKLEHGNLPRERGGGPCRELGESLARRPPGDHPQASPSRIQTNNTVHVDQIQTNKRLEVLNYLTKVKQEILSPLKAPILSSRNLPETIPTFQSLPSPIQVVNQSSDESDEDSAQVNSPKDAETKESHLTPNITDFDANRKVGTCSLAGEMSIMSSSSDEFDDDFIEVHNEDGGEQLAVVSGEEGMSDQKESSAGDSPNERKSPNLEIIIDSAEILQDDLFADVFENSSKQILNIPCKILEDKEINDSKVEEVSVSCLKMEEDSGSVRGEKVFEERESGGKREETGTEESPRVELAEAHLTMDQTPPAAPVPQLTVEEIIKMKKFLEKESSALILETRREERTASTITEQIRLDAQELLQLFGVPYLVAPMEAEAQCAYLDLSGQTQGTITDDSDIWLFGGKNVYKNFFDQKRFVQQFKSTDITRVLHLERDEMIMLALLTGSDYTLGLSGVGAVTALEVVANFPKTDSQQTPAERLRTFARELRQEKLMRNLAKKLKKASVSEGFPSSEVINAYLDPQVDTSTEKFSWSKPNLTELRRYARDKFGWDRTRTDKLLAPVLENLCKTQTQGTLHGYFDWDFKGASVGRSTRVEKALSILQSSSSQCVAGPSREPPLMRGQPLRPLEVPLKSKTPAQIAREKAAKKFKEIKKQGKVGTKSNKK